jgi:hypothetical protein
VTSVVAAGRPWGSRKLTTCPRDWVAIRCVEQGREDEISGDVGGTFDQEQWRIRHGSDALERVISEPCIWAGGASPSRPNLPEVRLAAAALEVYE